jgi:hypothetical protein
MPGQVIRRSIRLEGMEATRLVQCNINGILRPLLLLARAGILVDLDIFLLPRLRLLLRWLLLLRLLIALISRMLATAGACLLLLYGRHLGRTVPIIRPIISSLVPVIRAMKLPRCPGTTIVSAARTVPDLPTQVRVAWDLPTHNCQLS